MPLGPQCRLLGRPSLFSPAFSHRPSVLHPSLRPMSLAPMRQSSPELCQECLYSFPSGVHHHHLMSLANGPCLLQPPAARVASLLLNF